MMDASIALTRHLRLERRRVRWFFAGLLAAIGTLDVVEAFLGQHPLRDQTLEGLLPASIMQFSRTAVVVSGLALLLLARGLARGKHVAWLLTTAILGASAVFHLIKDLDIEQAVLALWLLLGLWWLRAHFQAASDPAALKRGVAALGAGVGLALLEALAGSLLLRHQLTPAVGFRRTLLQIASVLFGGSAYQPLSERARWFLASLPWVWGSLLVIGVIQLLRPVAAGVGASSEELARARRVARRWGHNPISWLALSRENGFCWAGESCFVAYRVRGKVAIALGDPIGPPAAHAHAITAFLDHCERRDWTPALYQTESAALYRRAGNTVLPIGSSATVHTSRFSLEGHERAPLRSALRRCRREGITFAFQSGSEAWELDAEELREVSSRWLLQKGGPELGFSYGRLESVDDPDVTVVAARDSAGRLLAFASLLPVPRRNGWTLDMMRRRQDAPHGVMEALIATSICEAQQRGLAEVNLGLALDFKTFSGMPPAYLAGLYRWLGGLNRVRSLRRFKEKFGPEWQPRYLVVNDARALPVGLTALVRAHLPGLLGMAGAVMALRYGLGRLSNGARGAGEQRHERDETGSTAA
jgi:phosphatidylglycerol lysyltransferase